MEFEPLNDDHSIEEVMFACHLSRRLGASDFRRVATAFEKVRSELPAINLDADSAVFAYLRPDGSATWAVSLHEGVIAVNCTRYSRWQKVWSTAQNYLTLGLQAIFEPEAVKITALALTVSDKFRGQQNSNPSVAGLLRVNNYVMPAAFSMDGLWHSHVGWFDSNYQSGSVLNQLNVDRVTEDAGDMGTPVVNIRHVLQLRFDQAPSAASLLQENQVSLTNAMEYMHANNKKILSDLLTSEMQARITLEPKL